MAVLWFNSCGDTYVTADIDKVFDSSSQTPLVAGSSGRNGGGALQIEASDTVTKSFPSQTTMIVGAAWYISSLPSSNQTFLTLRGGSTQHVVIQISNTGEIIAKRTTNEIGRSASGVMTAAAFRYIEVKATIHDTTGSVVVRIDGSVVLNLTNVDTYEAAFGDPAIIGAATWSGNSGFGVMYVDDIYICDTTGSSPGNDFLGDVRVDAVLPDGAGALTEFDTSTGTHYQDVDDAAPDGDTTYIQTATANDRDLFAYGAVPTVSGGSSVIAVAVKAWARKLDAGACSLRMLARPVSTNYAGTTIPLSVSYDSVEHIWELNPETSSAWTDATIDAAQFGVEKI